MISAEISQFGAGSPRIIEIDKDICLSIGQEGVCVHTLFSMGDLLGLQLEDEPLAF